MGGVVADRAALVVIDVQAGLIDGFEEDSEDVLPIISAPLTRARRASAPVVLVQHCGRGRSHPLNETASGWALHGAVDPQARDLRVRKAWSDSFQGTDLDDLLRTRAVTRVVLVGAQTEFCVDATARRALSLGYDVDLVADGHTTSENDVLSRAQIVAHHNATLGNLAADGVAIRVLPSLAIDFS
jgi:nicotinamidase-related amidase